MSRRHENYRAGYYWLGFSGMCLYDPVVCDGVDRLSVINKHCKNLKPHNVHVWQYIESSDPDDFQAICAGTIAIDRRTEKTTTDRARRLQHEVESNELLTVLYHLIRAAEHISPDETEIKDLSFQGEGDTEILLRFKGKAFALIAERF